MPPLRVKFKSETHRIEIEFDRTLGVLFEYLGEVIELAKLHCRLIVSGRAFVPSVDDSVIVGDVIKPDSLVLFIASSAADVDWVKRLKPDPLVKGFKQEEQDEIRRIMRTQELADATPWDTVQHAEFRFARFEVLYKRTNPTPFEADKLLQILATDPGIVKIMTTRRFKVGTLCEMDPEDADIEQARKGEVGQCLLGWNRNFGERISLRLRTDDLKSFRKYDSIMNTLIHELTHNIVGPHNDEFWAIFNQLKTVYSNEHGSRKSARMLSSALVAKERNLTKEDVEKVNNKAKATNGVMLGGIIKASDADEVRAARLKHLDMPKS